MSSSGAGASSRYAALALLSGPGLVAHLRTTTSRADYDAAARVLGDRDRRLAEAETGLADLRAEVEVLTERFLELKAKESRGPGTVTIAAAAAAAPRVGRRAEQPGPEGAIVDLCGSSDDDDDDMEEGEFRAAGVAGVSCKLEEPAASNGDEGRRDGVSCQRKESVSNGEERTPAGVSCKRKEPAASKGDEGRCAGVSCQQQESASKGEEERTPAAVSCKRKAPASASSHDDDDDRIPLSQLKRRRAQAVANGKPNNNKGQRDAHANSAGPLGVDRPAISPVNRGIFSEAVAERMVGRSDDPKVVAFVQGTENGQSGKNGGLSRTMPSPSPTGSTAGNSPRKNCSKPDGSEGQARIGEKQGRPVAGPENDVPVQVRTPKVMDTVRRIVGSARVGAERPMEHTSNETISVVLKSIEGQEKANGGVHKKVLPRTDGIREQESKLSPGQGRVDNHGGRPMTSDKPVSTTSQPKNQLALRSEQMSVESSLPSAVTRNWKSSSAVLNSCLRNKMLCMQAACALYRQKKFTTQPTVGGITKYDAHRVAVLAEFLLDGNLHGPLKRTDEDLEKHDSEGHDLLERVVLQCSEQLFSIYKNKEDKYFR